MEEKPNMKDLICELCNLQFDAKKVYDIHQSVLHTKKEIKDEPLFALDSLATFGESIVFEENESKEALQLIVKKEEKEVCYLCT